MESNSYIWSQTVDICLYHNSTIISRSQRLGYKRAGPSGLAELEQLHVEPNSKAVGVGAAGEASAAPLFQPPKFGHAHLLKLTWAVYCLTPALCAQPFVLIFANEDSDT